MDVLRKQKDATQGTVASLFNEWEQQLLATTREFQLLQDQLCTLKAALESRDHAIVQLKKDNSQLTEELLRLRYTAGPEDSPRWAALVEECNNLRQENEQQKETALANERELIKLLKKDREKLKSWNHFSSPRARPAHSHSSALAGPAPVPTATAHDSKSRSSISGEGGLDASTPRTYEHVADRARCPSAEARSPAKERDGRAELHRLRKSPEDSHTGDEVIVTSPSAAKPLSMPESDDERLPQMGRCDPTGRSAEGSAMTETQKYSAGKQADSGGTPFLEAYPASKTGARQDFGDGLVPVGNQAEAITINSDPATSLDISSLPPASSMDGSLKPASWNCQPATSGRRYAPPQSVPSSSKPSDENGFGDVGSGASHASIDQPPGPSTSNWSSHGRDVGGKADRSRPLSQVDGNARNLPRIIQTGYASKSRKRKSDDRRALAAIPTISEDGEEYSEKAHKLRNRGTSSAHVASPSVQQRLDNLLERPSDQKSSLIQISDDEIGEMLECLWSASLFWTPKGQKPYNALLECENRDWEWWDKAERTLCAGNMTSPTMPPWHPSRAGQRKSPSAKDAKTSITGRPVLKSSATAGISRSFGQSSWPRAAVSDNKQAAYRSLPLSSLQLQHFKLNPAANHNLDHAYTDVIRKQSDRRCIPGCTRPECCGPKFAALAQTLFPGDQGKARAAKRLTLDQLSEPDKKILYGYLGAHYHTLSNNNKDENKDDLSSLLHLARTSHLSNQHGRCHRSTHHPRPATPPGFWNVDFPTTQEQAESRSLAEARQAEEVCRRWREAVKNAPAAAEAEAEARGDVTARRKGAGSEPAAAARRGEEMGVWMFADE